MYERGEPGETTKGYFRGERETLGGKTTVVYVGENVYINLPLNVFYWSKDNTIRVQDVNMRADDVYLKCKNLVIVADKVDIQADVVVHGNFTTFGGITHLNPSSTRPCPEIPEVIVPGGYGEA